MRRLLVLSFLGAAAFAAACNSDITKPSDGGKVAASRQPPPCQEITQQQVNDLFPPAEAANVSQQLAHIRDDVKKGDFATAQAEMFPLWSQTVGDYYAGTLNGGFSTDTQDKTLNFGAQLYCLVGLDGSSFLTGNPLASDNKLQVVFPSSSTTDVVAGNGKGGTRIGAGALSAPSTFTIVLITDTFAPFQGPLNTKLDQYGPYFEIKMTPSETLNQPILVAQCISGWSGGDVPVSVHLAHNVGTGIEILGKEPSFIDCSGSASNGPTAGQYFAHGETWNGIRALGRAAARIVMPRLAYAGTIGVGGKATSFSPYGGVDTATVIETVSVTSQSAPAGSAVSAPPKVRVRTTGAQTPLDGANVTFAITQGAGALTGASQVTGLDGTATVGSWSLGAGPNTVTATGAFPAPPTGVGVGVDGNPVAFNATGTEVMTWQAPGYKYLAGKKNFLSNFQSPGFSDATWNTGPAAFGSHDATSLVCPLDATVATNWPYGTKTNDMLLRHTFPLFTGWAKPLTISVAIEDQIQVFVNGTDITSTASAGFNPKTGFVENSACATLASSTFTVPATLLVGGTNLVAVRARGDNTDQYVDLQIVATP